jgi:hypothetical protein
VAPNQTLGAQAMQARFYGLLMIIAGVVLTATMLGLFFAMGRWIGSFTGWITIVISLSPVMLIFAGWLQVLTGLPFSKLSVQFDSSPPLKKIWLSVVFLVSSMIFILYLMKLIVWIA